MANGSIFARTRERRGQSQDIAALQQFIQNRQRGLADPNVAPIPFPSARSQTGVDLFSQFLLNQQQQRGALNVAQTRRPPPTPGQFQVNQAQQILQIPENQRTDEQRNILRVAQGLPTITKELSTKAQAAKNFAEASKLAKESGGQLSAEQKFKQANVFRKDFDSLSGDFRKIRDSFQRIKAVAADPSAAGDIAIIFNFMKMLDPGSVVRESEFATAENAAGVPTKTRNLYNKLLTGERIAVNRGDFVKQANNLFRSQQKTQQKLVDQFTKRSERLGINPADVITPVDINVPNPLASQLQQGEILVRQKSTGQIGALPENEFDPNNFERVK